MTPSWQHPTDQDPKLYLPIISKQNWEHTHPLPEKSNYHITLSQAEQSIWNTPSSNPTSKSFFEELLTLCQLMTQFFKCGETLDTFDTKDGPDDHVTIVDMGIEWLIRNWLSRSAPNDKILGEEGPKPTLAISERFWVIDPLDGTSNFIQKQPHIAFNMAGYDQGKLIFACVLNPDQNINYFGYKVNETTYTNMTITPDHTTLIGTEYKHTKSAQNQFYQQLIADQNTESHQFKSISINIAKLLTIKTPLFYKPYAKIWDMCAPMGLFHFAGLDQIYNHIYYVPGHPMISDTCETVAIEELDELFIEHLNQRNAIDSRVGTAITFHQDLMHLRDEILEFFIQSPSA